MKQFADISGYQKAVNWAEYVKWSDMVAIKATEGVGFVDPLFEEHRAGAFAAGIKTIWYYHFARPDLGNAPRDESAWFAKVIVSIRSTDRVVLDYERNSTTLLDANWALSFLQSVHQNPILYSGLNFVKAFLQSEQLSHFDQWIAAYGSGKPGSPLAWQFTDKAVVPGIAGPVDCSYYYGGDSVNWDNFNQMVVDLWNSQEAYFKALGQELPARDTGIFTMWRQAWLDGHFKGVPLSREYPLGGGVAQNFAGGTAHWVNGQGQWL